MVRVSGFCLYRYSIVWFLGGGEWPKLLDHKNRDQLDDRIENLRIASHSQNHANTCLQTNNTSGFKGVSWYSRGSKWEAYIKVDGRRIKLGYYADIREACNAYVEAAKKHFGDFHYAGS
jgi:hypothetical protein